MEFDRIDCFGKISVRIPHNWAEGEGSEGSCEFFEPNGKSGTLRVTLFTVERNEQCTPEVLQDEDLENRQEATARFFRIGDRVAAEWNEPAKKEKDVHMYYWTVAAVESPSLTRQALFSYTVSIGRTKEADFSSELDIIRECIFATYS